MKIIFVYPISACWQLATTASEVYCERVFSLCGDLTARQRNRTTEALETRVFLKVNSVRCWKNSTAC